MRAAQGAQIDGVAGATVSSNAVFAAVAEALEASGADVAAIKSAPAELRAPETVEKNTQIVVIGAGMAGFSAAIEAAEAGKDVLLLERFGVYSASTTRSEGMVMGAGTNYQKAHGIEDDPEDMYNDMYALYAQEDTTPPAMRAWTRSLARIRSTWSAWTRRIPRCC